MFNVINEIKENIYTEIYQHYIYITLILGPVRIGDKHFPFSETSPICQAETWGKHGTRVQDSLSQLWEIARILHKKNLTTHS